MEYNREDPREGFCHRPHLVTCIPIGERHHCWNLEQTDLQRVCRANLHAVYTFRSQCRMRQSGIAPEGYVSVHGERHGIHELCSVGN